MKIRDMFTEKKPTISFEIFPPKSHFPIDTIYNTIESLQDLDPDFISVTYGGSKDYTIDIASTIKNKYNIESIAHLTCITSSQENVIETLQNLKDKNVENILALRGDIPPELQKNKLWKPSYQFAGELIDEITQFDAFSIGGAAYPEGHIESMSKVNDLKHLKSKVDKGLDFLITQLFFDNELFYQFQDNLELLDIKKPVIAGIFPVVNINQFKKVQELTQANLPAKFMRIINKYEHNPEALKEAGIAYAVDQIIDLLSSGIDGIHIYTMNRPENTREIMKNIGTIRDTLLDNNRR